MTSLSQRRRSAVFSSSFVVLLRRILNMKAWYVARRYMVAGEWVALTFKGFFRQAVAWRQGWFHWSSSYVLSKLYCNGGNFQAFHSKMHCLVSILYSCAQIMSRLERNFAVVIIICILQRLGYMTVHCGVFLTRRRLVCVLIALDKESDQYRVHKQFYYWINFCATNVVSGR